MIAVTAGVPIADGRPDRGPQVLTNSWNRPAVEGCDLATFVPATAAFAAAGTFVVASAGNSGPGCATVNLPPGPYPDVVTVGVTDHAGVVAASCHRRVGQGAKAFASAGSSAAKAGQCRWIRLVIEVCAIQSRPNWV